MNNCTIAFFGTGTLGFPMAEQLLKHRYRLFVYNRTRSKAAPLAKKGATIARTPGEALREAQAVIVVLTDYPAIRKMLFGSAHSLKGKTVIQMSTIGSDESRRLKQRIEKAGGDYLECPVLGSKGEAASRSLILMVGGSAGQFRRWRKLLRCFGSRIYHAGPVGSAAALKLALNQLIASHAASFSLSLGMVRKNRIDVAQFMNILNGSSLIAPMYAKKLPNWLARRYDNPNFSLRHLLKDVDLIIKEACRSRLNPAVIGSIRKILKKSVNKGLGDKDYSAMYETINKSEHEST